MKLDFTLDCPLPRDEVFAALTDFTPNRVLLYPNLSAQTFKVISRTDHSAVVIEGTGPFTSEEEYHWTNSERVWSHTKHSSVYAPGSITDIRLRVTVEGGTHIIFRIERGFVGTKGRLLEVLIRLNGRTRYFRKTYRAVMRNAMRQARRARRK
jgi:hypothetical protein